jgi:hypothetical protein
MRVGRRRGRNGRRVCDRRDRLRHESPKFEHCSLFTVPLLALPELRPTHSAANRELQVPSVTALGICRPARLQHATPRQQGVEHPFRPDSRPKRYPPPPPFPSSSRRVGTVVARLICIQPTVLGIGGSKGGKGGGRVRQSTESPAKSPRRGQTRGEVAGQCAIAAVSQPCGAWQRPPAYPAPPTSGRRFQVQESRSLAGSGHRCSSRPWCD